METMISHDVNGSTVLTGIMVSWKFKSQLNHLPIIIHNIINLSVLVKRLDVFNSNCFEIVTLNQAGF